MTEGHARTTARTALAVGALSLATAVTSSVAVAAKKSDMGIAGKPDGAYVSVTGTVVTSDTGVFALDYGDSTIQVEMDDWGPFDDAVFIDPGDRVTVDGRVDDGFYEARTIEASRVFSYDQSTYYYASAADEEGDMFAHPVFSRPVSPATADEGTWVSMTGIVTEVDGREFMLENGNSTMEVDTEELAYNPLDDIGRQQIDLGDEVSVVGEIDDDLFDDKEISATRIYSIAATY